MIHDDIRDRAVDLLRSHGDAAALHAAMNADEALQRGDDDAHRLWLSVAKTIERIDRIDPERMVQ